MRNIPRSIGSVFAGFVTTAALSLGVDVVMHQTGVYPEWGKPMSDALFVWAATYRLAFGVLGGYVTARLAPRFPMFHAMVLGVIGSIAAGAGMVATWNSDIGPRWYTVFLFLTALPTVWAGASQASRSRPGS